MGSGHTLWFPDLLCPQALLRYCGELGKGPWVCASPQDVYTSGRQGMAEPGTGAECRLVPNECQEYSGAGASKERGRALSRRFMHGYL